MARPLGLKARPGGPRNRTPQTTCRAPLARGALALCSRWGPGAAVLNAAHSGSHIPTAAIRKREGPEARTSVRTWAEDKTVQDKVLKDLHIQSPNQGILTILLLFF